MSTRLFWFQYKQTIGNTILYILYWSYFWLIWPNQSEVVSRLGSLPRVGQVSQTHHFIFYANPM